MPKSINRTQASDAHKSLVRACQESTTPTSYRGTKLQLLITAHQAWFRDIVTCTNKNSMRSLSVPQGKIPRFSMIGLIDCCAFPLASPSFFLSFSLARSMILPTSLQSLFPRGDYLICT